MQHSLQLEMVQPRSHTISSRLPLQLQIANSV
nr:MAG TPA: hypothetical protein [Bacteriophage sp.]